MYRKLCLHGLSTKGRNAAAGPVKPWDGGPEDRGSLGENWRNRTGLGDRRA